MTDPQKPGSDDDLITRIVTQPHVEAKPADFDDDDRTRVVGNQGLGAATSSAVPSAAPLAAPSPATLPGETPLLQTSPTGTLPGRTLAGASTRRLPEEGSGENAVRQVGRYLIESRLGRGGMATVYKAQDPQIGRAVAIKFLHASLAEDEECHARFLIEARAAGSLQHPNIVVVHDVGEIERRPYMAMELIDGQSLADVLEKQKLLPVRDATVIALQLARALDYAHARGVVHRDIKPGNIMLLANNKTSGQTVKVTDFGIAHMDDASNQRTQVGAVLGTPQYMSPEQTRGEKIDGRSDLFSAGIVLYQMLTGERPFRGESLVVVATRIANDTPTPVAQLRPDVPPALRRVLDRCLAKAPAQRFASGQDMADALGKVLTEIDEAAREKAKPRIVPLRVKWAAAMALTVALVMGITGAIVTQRQYAALMGQATEYGASLARFVARQHAANALSEDWGVVDVSVQEMMKTGNFERIVVVDKAGVVRAGSVPELLGQPYKAAGTESLGQLAGGTAAVRYQAQGESVLGFESPMTFQETVVGRVALGIPERPLTQVANLSILLMVVLVLVTVAAVALAMYFLADWFAKPIRLVRDSLGEIAKGNFTHRIGEQRKDEFGQLFADFDHMAQALQAREVPAVNARVADAQAADVQAAGPQTATASADAATPASAAVESAVGEATPAGAPSADAAPTLVTQPTSAAH